MSGRSGCPGEVLEPLEVAVAPVVERDDLAVQHRWAAAAGVGEGQEFGVGGGDVRAGP